MAEATVGIGVHVNALIGGWFVMIEVDCEICGAVVEKVESFGLYWQYRIDHQWVIEQNRFILCKNCYHVVKALRLEWPA